MTRQTQMLKGEAQITAWNAMGRPAQNVSSDPGEIALGLLQMSWLRVAAYSEMLRRQVQAETDAASGGTAGTGEAGHADGLKIEGLIGSRKAATNAGEIYETSEEVRALVLLESQERDRAMAYAVAAHKMGISNRLTALAEQWGEVVAGRVSAMLDELHLTAAQQKRVPTLVQSYLGSIDVSEIGPGR